MRSNHPGFDGTFTTNVRDAFVKALDRAYETACEHYEPSRGNNTKTFGYELYHAAVFHLCAEAERTSELTILSREPVFRFRAGTAELACHRVGRTATEDIWGSFPNNDGAAQTMLEPSLWLPGLEPTLDRASKFVLAHLGDHDRGLEAVYLCVPARTEGERIVEWAFAEKIYVKESSSVPATNDSAERHKAEVVEEVVVQRKDERSKDERGA